MGQYCSPQAQNRVLNDIYGLWSADKLVSLETFPFRISGRPIAFVESPSNHFESPSVDGKDSTWQDFCLPAQNSESGRLWKGTAVHCTWRNRDVIERAIRTVSLRLRFRFPDAEDFRQDALVHLLKHREHVLRIFRGKSSLGTYLVTGLMRFGYRWTARRRRDRVAPEVGAQLQTAEAPPHTPEIRFRGDGTPLAVRCAVSLALARLSPADRVVLWLKLTRPRKYSAEASRLGLSRTAADKHVAHAKAVLRREFASAGITYSEYVAQIALRVLRATAHRCLEADASLALADHARRTQGIDPTRAVTSYVIEGLPSGRSKASISADRARSKEADPRSQ